MSKERSEDIKSYYSEMQSFDPGTQSDIKFLIEQAERAGELEEENKLLKLSYDNNTSVGMDLLKQNKRYREKIRMALSDMDDYDFESARLILRHALLN